MGQLLRAAPATVAGLILAWTTMAAAQDVRSLAPSAIGAPADLADLNPMIGDWVAKDGAAGFSAPAAGRIVGHLLLYTDAGVRAQEFWVLRPENGSILLRQKRFTPDLKDRDDKDKFLERWLVAHDAGHLYFDNMTLVTKADAMDLLVRLAGQNGAPPTVVTYNFKRVK